ncbi:silencing boundary-establishment protein Fub1p [Monosporozyma unispora]|nr:hypothetical protein C6P44_003968 [Kazachstania unispora]
MIEIKSTLEFLAYATYEALLEVGIVTKLEQGKVESANNLVRISLNSLTPVAKVIEIIAVEVAKDDKGMITLCDENDNTLASHTFNYDNELGINGLELPLKWEEYISQHKEEVNRLTTKIITGLNLHPKPTLTQKPKSSTTRTAEETTPLAGPVPVPPSFTRDTDTRRSGIDIPKFDDEYEINKPSRLGPQPGIGFQPERPGYGDQDLFPMGQRNPSGSNLGPFGPQPGTGNIPGVPGQGGMIFEPFGQNRDQMLRDEQDRRGPGWIPGSKYDDPFGRPGTGGSDFPGSGSGSGSGFPGSGSGFGFM